MTKKKLTRRLYASLGVSLLVGVLAVVGGVQAFQSYEVPPKVVVEGDYIEAVSSEAPFVEESFGALASPDIPTDWLRVGGLMTNYGHMSMKTGTTTPCAIQSPVTTSTLVFGSATFDISSTSASVVSMSKSATAFVTTTALTGTTAIGANAQGNAVLHSASTTDFVFAPNEWLVVGMQGGTGDFSPAGFCNAEFKSLY